MDWKRIEVDKPPNDLVWQTFPSTELASSGVTKSTPPLLRLRLSTSIDQICRLSLPPSSRPLCSHQLTVPTYLSTRHTHSCLCFSCINPSFCPQSTTKAHEKILSQQARMSSSASHQLSLAPFTSLASLLSLAKMDAVMDCTFQASLQVIGESVCTFLVYK